MNKLFRFFASSVIALTLLFPAPAQVTPLQAGSTPHSLLGDEVTGHDLYQQFSDTYKVDEPKAYKLAKEYLRKYPQKAELTQFVKRWVDYYEARVRTRRKIQFQTLLAGKRHDEIFALGNEILRSEPNDVVTLNNLTTAGLVALIWHNNQTFVMDASKHARKALALIETGQSTETDLLIGLNFALSIFCLKSSPAESETYFYEAMRLAALKRNPHEYAFMANAILAAEYEPLQKDYNARYHTVEQKSSMQAKTAWSKLTRVIDRIIYAQARAVALAGADENYVQLKIPWMQFLTDLYRLRNSGYDTGLEEFIEEMLDKPSPP